MAAVTIHSDFRAQETKSLTTSAFSPSICHEVMEPDAMILVSFFFFFLIFSFKPAFHSPPSPQSMAESKEETRVTCFTFCDSKW